MSGRRGRRRRSASDRKAPEGFPSRQPPEDILHTTHQVWGRVDPGRNGIIEERVTRVDRESRGLFIGVRVSSDGGSGIQEAALRSMRTPDERINKQGRTVAAP